MRFKTREGRQCVLLAVQAELAPVFRLDDREGCPPKRLKLYSVMRVTSHDTVQCVKSMMY